MVEMNASLFFLILNIVCMSWAIAINATNAEFATFTDKADDDEQELSMQLHDVETRANGWAEWSEWSSCSRSCDGGVAHQLRRCKVNGCRGDRIRHKICNMQPCAETQDFRDAQCAAYNSALYEGGKYMWQAHYDDLEPCALVCRGYMLEGLHNLQNVKTRESNIKQMEEDVTKLAGYVSAYESADKSVMEETNDLETHIVIAKKADKVQDGTRCRPGSLDMCINGHCQERNKF